MITTEGKTHIKRYLAGLVPSIAQSIAFGIGANAESLADTALQFEVSRADITLTSYDFVNNKLVFKGILPDAFGGKVYEAAIFSMPANQYAGIYGSRLLSSFDSESELWVTNSGVPVYSTSNARIGIDSLNHTPAASATSTSVLSEILLDFSQNSAADTFNLAFNAGNSNTASVTFRLKNDAGNYYSFSVSNPSSGYNFATFTKGSATITGAPDWANITSIEVSTVSKAGGASNIDYEGLRIEDVDTLNPDYVMVAREVLSTPFVKTEGMVQEVEFTLDINV